MKTPKQKTKNNNKEFIARLMAVQACYQMIYNKKPVQMVVEEYLAEGLQTDDELENIDEGTEVVRISDTILPHGGLFKKILYNLEDRRSELKDILGAHINTAKDIEPLLQAVLLCGACEILENTKTDYPIILNDYLDITHEFYPQAQVAFVNGILDAVSKSLR
ncbi:MAG: transcription antitermination factor NusB [Alphaproteobacteria bacterium]